MLVGLWRKNSGGKHPLIPYLSYYLWFIDFAFIFFLFSEKMDGSPLWLGIFCIFAGLMTKDIFLGIFSSFFLSFNACFFMFVCLVLSLFLSFNVCLSMSVFQCPSFNVCLSMSVFQCLSFNVCLSMSVFQCLSFNVCLSMSVFQCLSFNVCLSMSVFQCLSFKVCVSPEWWNAILKFSCPIMWIRISQMLIRIIDRP